MRITRNAIDALYRFALAEHFTSPTEPARYDIQAMILRLRDAKYIEHDGKRFVLTPAGVQVLKDRLPIVTLLQLQRYSDKWKAKP